MANDEPKNEAAGQGGERRDFIETHPNPHGGHTIDETPIDTDHGRSVRKNVAQTTNTIKNQVHPSVEPESQDPSSDSMFNNADPQTAELLKNSPGGDHVTARARHTRRRKTR